MQTSPSSELIAEASPGLTAEPSSGGLDKRLDLVWRVAELVLVVLGFVFWLLRLDLLPELAVALLAGSWGARFIWAVNNVQVQEDGRVVSKMERVTARGAQLSMIVGLYLSLLEGTTLAVIFLFGALALILLERVWFMLDRLRGRQVA